MQHQRGPHVFGLRLGIHAADVEHRRPAEQHIGANAEGSIEVITARLDEAVEHRLHVPGTPGDDVAHVAVGLRGLYEGHRGVHHERQGLLQELRPRHEVRVQDHEEVAFRHCQRVVDVARLGAVVGEAADVADLQAGREIAHLVGLAVVENPGLVRPSDCHRGFGGSPDDVDRLAVGGDQDVDFHLLPVQMQRPAGGIVGDVQFLVGSGVVEVALRVVERERARVLHAREDRPHRHQRVKDENDLRNDHHRPWHQVPTVAGIEQEPRVGKDADRGGEGYRDHNGGVRVLGPGSACCRNEFVFRSQVWRQGKRGHDPPRARTSLGECGMQLVWLPRGVGCTVVELYRPAGGRPGTNPSWGSLIKLPSS
ncbi:hypothetical protein SDC9_113035 [bioreactor metagenome]|uniref:Uncharacterized protein n=1 Tax=bioreactor metagenome TaxID=1076179 RepID=A0A645BLW7_9ZZZZ